MQILHLVPKNCLSSSDLRPDNKVSPDCTFQSSRRPRKGPRPNKITKASLLAGVGFALAMNWGQTGYCAPDVSDAEKSNHKMGNAVKSNFKSRSK